MSASLWYVERGGELLGPMPRHELHRLVSSGTYSPATRVTPDVALAARPVRDLVAQIAGEAEPWFDVPAAPPPVVPPDLEDLKEHREPPPLPPTPGTSIAELPNVLGCPPERIKAEIDQCKRLTLEQSQYLAALTATRDALQAAITAHNEEVRKLRSAAKGLQKVIDLENLRRAIYTAKWARYQLLIRNLTVVTPAIWALWGDLDSTYSGLETERGFLVLGVLRLVVLRQDLETETDALLAAHSTLIRTKLKFMHLLRALIARFRCKPCRGLRSLYFQATCLRSYFDIHAPKRLPPLAFHWIDPPDQPVAGPVPPPPPDPLPVPCPCTYTTRVDEDPPRLEISMDSIPLVNHQGVIGLDAQQPQVLLSAYAWQNRSLSIAIADAGTTPRTGAHAMSAQVFEYEWLVDGVDVAAFAGTSRAASGTIATARTPAVELRTGARVSGCGVIVEIDPTQYFVDRLVGVPPAQEVDGKLADIRIRLRCEAIGSSGRASQAFVLVLSAMRDHVPHPALQHYYLASLEGLPLHSPFVPPPASAPVSLPTFALGAGLDDCTPVIEGSVASFSADLLPMIPDIQTAVAGDVLALEIDTVQDVLWTARCVHPDCPSTGDIASFKARARPSVVWHIQWISGTSVRGVDPICVPMADPLGAFIMIPHVREDALLEVVALASSISVNGMVPALEAMVRFEVKVRPRKLVLDVLDTHGEAASHQRYRFAMGDWESDVTNVPHTGKIEEVIDPLGYQATLEVIGSDEQLVEGPPCTYDLAIGALMASATHSGARSRLNNLGYAAGPEGSPWPAPVLRRALQRFQVAEDLETAHVVNAANVSGVLDDATLNALERSYDER